MFPHRLLPPPLTAKNASCSSPGLSSRGSPALLSTCLFLVGPSILCWWAVFCPVRQQKLFPDWCLSQTRILYWADTQPHKERETPFSNLLPPAAAELPSPLLTCLSGTITSLRPKVIFVAHVLPCPPDSGSFLKGIIGICSIFSSPTKIMQSVILRAS